MSAPAPIPEVQVNTTMGTFTVELYPKHAPKTCQNFSELACVTHGSTRTSSAARAAAVALAHHLSLRVGAGDVATMTTSFFIALFPIL